MFEIEAKVKLTEKQYKDLKKKIPKLAKKSEEDEYQDHYYADPKKFYLRIRNQKNGKSFLNLKTKERGQGIEKNQEIGLQLKSPEKFRKFLSNIDIKKTHEKQKKSTVYRKRDIRIELNTVNNLGYFLEIEIIVYKKSRIPNAKKELNQTFKTLGFSQKEYEKKYYLEMTNK